MFYFLQKSISRIPGVLFKNLVESWGLGVFLKSLKNLGMPSVFLSTWQNLRGHGVLFF